MSETLDKLTEQELELKAEIDVRKARIDALNEEGRALQKVLRAKYLEDRRKRYADLDLTAALIGAQAKHTIKLATMEYDVSPPPQSMIREVTKLADVSPSELVLAAWLQSVSFGGRSNEIGKLALTDRLESIRRLPEIVVHGLAEICNDLHLYLQLAMEEQLGNY